MKRIILLFTIGCFFLSSAFSQPGGEFTIARLKYAGGGDWYSNPTSLPNLLIQLSERLEMDCEREEKVVTIDDADLFRYPLLYMNGHGTVRFSDGEIQRLREYFRRGGVLWADDNYGIDTSFREEITKVFPDHPLKEIPYDHPVFSIYYQFEHGLPKIHEHDGGPPHLYGVYLDGRLVVIYTFDTDIGDGLESEGAHPLDSAETREQAMRMAINIVLFVLSS